MRRPQKRDIVCHIMNGVSRVGVIDQAVQFGTDNALSLSRINSAILPPTRATLIMRARVIFPWKNRPRHTGMGGFFMH